MNLVTPCLKDACSSVGQIKACTSHMDMNRMGELSESSAEELGPRE